MGYLRERKRSTTRSRVGNVASEKRRKKSAGAELAQIHGSDRTAP